MFADFDYAFCVCSLTMFPSFAYTAILYYIYTFTYVSVGLIVNKSSLCFAMLKTILSMGHLAISNNLLKLLIIFS